MMAAKTHNHGPCEKCNLEGRKSAVMRAVLLEAERMIPAIGDGHYGDALETRGLIGRIRRASRGQMMVNGGVR